MLLVKIYRHLTCKYTKSVQKANYHVVFSSIFCLFCPPADVLEMINLIAPLFSILEHLVEDP